ncbi:MAG: DUF4349 domain-containing protein [Dehalococcoidia bacterium]
MSRQLDPPWHGLLSRPDRRRARALLVGVGAFVVIAVVGAFALAAGVLPGNDDSDQSSRETASGGGAVAPSDPGALRAPEESSAGALGAPAFDDAKGGAAPPDAARSVNDGFGQTGTTLPSLDAGRTIIRGASVDLEVEVVADAFERVSQIATVLGGYVGDSTFSGSGEHQTAYLTLRVPADRFGDAIAQIRGLAVEVQSLTTSARDVTEEYSDIEATLRNLRAVEQRYVELLGRAGSIGDILQVQDRLNQVRLEIDRMEARRQLIASQSELATISVSLRPVDSDGPVSETRGPLDAAADAWQASLDTLSTLATAVLVVVVYSWWIVPPALVLVVVARRLWWRRPPSDEGTASD